MPSRGMTVGSLFTGIGGLRSFLSLGTYPVMPRGAKPKVYPPDLVNRVRELYAANHTQVEIAIMVGTSQKVIWRLMDRNGIKRRPQIKRNQLGERNAAWKGGAATYTAFHHRIYAMKGKPKRCEVCHTTNPALWYDWANLTGQFDDPRDYRRMCRSCHRQYDKQRRKEVLP